VTSVVLNSGAVILSAFISRIGSSLIHNAGFSEQQLDSSSDEVSDQHCIPT
jgi:hypothetical protein